MEANQNYTEAVELAKAVIRIADEEMGRGMPNPTCGKTCYRIAVALLHSEVVLDAYRARAQWESGNAGVAA